MSGESPYDSGESPSISSSRTRSYSRSSGESPSGESPRASSSSNLSSTRQSVDVNRIIRPNTSLPRSPDPKKPPKKTNPFRVHLPDDFNNK